MSNEQTFAGQKLSSPPYAWTPAMEAALDWSGPDEPRPAYPVAAAKYGQCLVDALALDLPWDRMGQVGAHRFAAPGGLVYFVGGDTGPVKIGFSTIPVCRIHSMQAGSPIVLRFLAVTVGGLAVEQKYHKRFAAHRLHGEWFERDRAITREINRLNRHPAKEPNL